MIDKKILKRLKPKDIKRKQNIIFSIKFFFLKYMTHNAILNLNFIRQ